MALTALAVASIVVVIVATIWGLGRVLNVLSPILWPLAVAAVIAYLLDPVVDFLEKRRLPRARAIILVFGLALVIVAGVLASILPRIIDETQLLIERIPVYSQRVQQRVEHWLANPPDPLRDLLRRSKEPVLPDAGTNAAAPPIEPELVPAAPATPATPSWSDTFDSKMVASAATWVTSLLPQVGSWLLDQFLRVVSWFGMLIGLALIPVYAFYFLLQKHAISRKWTEYLPLGKSDLKDELVFILRSINDYLIAFFRGQVLVAICDGILYTIGFLAIGLNYAFLIGFFAVFLTIIPFLGAFIICTAALILAFVQFGDWLHPLLVLGVFGIVQFLEGFVIQPKILGDRVGLHPLTIIIAVVAGTTLMGGLLGGILAIPLTAALRVLMFRYVWKTRAARAKS